MKGYYLPVVVILALMVAFGLKVKHDNELVNVDKAITYECNSKFHDSANRVWKWKTAKKPLVIKRGQVALESAESIVEVCPACRAAEAKDAEQKATMERENQARREAERLANQFGWQFGFGWRNMSELITEESLRPGESIMFCLKVENRSSEPISELKVLITPKKYLRLEKLTDSSFQWRAKLEAEAFRLLDTEGLTVYDDQERDVLYPKGSKYYPANQGSWLSYSRAIKDKSGRPSFLMAGSMYGFQERLRLASNLQAGQDIYFEGFLVYQDHKIPLGRLTVHVMYSG